MFAKIFTQILDSSLASDYQVRLVFEDLLKLCDVNGVVDMTPDAIARRTNVPLEIVRRGIEELEKPDAMSRTPDHEGKRLVRLDQHRPWGWVIVNYSYYRGIASEDQRREKTRDRVRKFRDINGLHDCNAPVTHGNACNAMERERERQREIEIGDAEEDVSNTAAGVNVPKEFALDEPKPTAKHIPSNQADELWLEMLCKSKAYQEIDVMIEYEKMVIWCKNKRKTPTKTRFIAWLNRCDRPMNISKQNSDARQGRPENIPLKHLKA